MSFFVCLFSVAQDEIIECPEAVATGSSTGYITSPGFPNNNYPNNKRCQWTLNVPQGFILVLDFDFVNLEEPGDMHNQCYDYVQV